MAPVYWALIPAAGAGLRVGAPRPKQYIEVHGRALLAHTLARFVHHPRIAGVVVSLDAADDYWATLTIESPIPVETVAGGASRSHSVLNGLEHLGARGDAQDWVLVHDAARPCLRAADVDRLMDTLTDDPVGGLLAAPVGDTLKRADHEQRSAGTVERSGLWQALTPQMFRLERLTHALRDALAGGVRVTDEAAAVERLGLRPRLVEGRSDNIKVTRPDDLTHAARLLAREDEGNG